MKRNKVPYVVRIHRFIHKPFRRARWAIFSARMSPDSNTRILDVGGTPASWIKSGLKGLNVTLLNQWAFASLPSDKDCDIKFSSLKGDGCNLEFEEGQFEIAYSNSVIEHVGTWENQVGFAKGIRKSGKRIWVQTPAKEFLIEPHYLSPFVHWLPNDIQKRFNRWITLWGWLHKPTPEMVSDRVDELRLITLKEMKILFPDCEIVKEKFLGIFTKSYIAVRANPED